MTVCKYYLQGNCRFGDRCWNEHIGTSTNQYDRGSPTNQYDRGSPTEYRYSDDYYKKYHYFNPRYSPPPPRSPFSFSSQRSSNDQKEGVNFSFNKALTEVSTKNQFAAVGEHTENSNIKNKESDEIEFIKDDMMRWEMGKQWPFSCYAPVKVCFPGFEDISPEELRWQYYNAKGSGTLHVHLQNINEYAEQMKLRRNELKSASLQVIATLKSLQTDAKQQDSIFGNVQSAINSSKNLDKPVFGTEKTSPQKFGNSSNFRFSLSDLSEQPKSPFRLPQFKTQDNQTNMFGNSTQTIRMETSIFGSADGESEKHFSHNIGNTAFTSPFVQQKDSDPTNIHNSGLSNIDDNNDNELEAMPNNNNTEYIYTELKMLNRSEKEQYTSNAKCFVLKKIPSKPPPREMCF